MIRLGGFWQTSMAGFLTISLFFIHWPRHWRILPGSAKLLDWPEVRIEIVIIVDSVPALSWENISWHIVVGARMQEGVYTMAQLQIRTPTGQ